MSRTPPEQIPCPRCGAPVGPEQSWCLACGAPARTRMRPTPNWKLPLVVIAVVVLVVAGGTVGAFVALTTENEAPKASTVPTTSVPAAAPPSAPETPVDPAATAPVDPGATAPPPAVDPGVTAPEATDAVPLPDTSAAPDATSAPTPPSG